jgi:hypothetical protein
MYSEDILINNLKVDKKKLQVAEDKLTILDLKSFDSSCALFCFLIKKPQLQLFSFVAIYKSGKTRNRVFTKNDNDVLVVGQDERNLEKSASTGTRV